MTLVTKNVCLCIVVLTIKHVMINFVMQTKLDRSLRLTMVFEMKFVVRKRTVTLMEMTVRSVLQAVSSTCFRTKNARRFVKIKTVLGITSSAMNQLKTTPFTSM